MWTMWLLRKLEILLVLMTPFRFLPPTLPMTSSASLWAMVVVTNGTPAAFADPFEMYQHNTAENVEGISSMHSSTLRRPRAPTCNWAWRSRHQQILGVLVQSSQTGQADVDFDIFSSESSCSFCTTWRVTSSIRVFLKPPPAVQFSVDIFAFSDTSTSGVDIFYTPPAQCKQLWYSERHPGFRFLTYYQLKPIQSNRLMDDILTLDPANQSISDTNYSNRLFGWFWR